MLRCVLTGQAELDAVAALSSAVKDLTGSGSSKRRRNAASAAATTAAECVVLDDEETPAAKRHRGAPEGTDSEAGPSQTLAERLAERAKATAPSGQPAGTSAPELAPKASDRAEPVGGCPAVARSRPQLRARLLLGQKGGLALSQRLARRRRRQPAPLLRTRGWRLMLDWMPPWGLATPSSRWAHWLAAGMWQLSDTASARQLVAACAGLLPLHGHPKWAQSSLWTGAAL